MIQNHPKGCEPRKSCAYIKLTSTEPAVNIPVDVVDYGMNSYSVDELFIYVLISNVPMKLSVLYAYYDGFNHNLSACWQLLDYLIFDSNSSS